MRCVLALLFCAWYAPRARAEPPRAIHIESDGCPDAASVAVELKALLPRARMGEAPNAIEVRVFDEGDHYRVAVEGVERTIADRARRCADRAHAVAVVADLILAPPTSEVPAPRRPPPIFVDLETSGQFALAPNLGSGGVLLTGGGELRLDVGWRWIAASLGVRGLAPVSPAFSAARAELARIPVDLDARFCLRRRRLELSSLVGVSLAALRVEGRGLAPGLTETRFDPAAHLVLGVRVWLWHWVGLEATVGADVIFQRFDLVVDPRGVVGQTPRLWLGLGLGPVFRLKNEERN